MEMICPEGKIKLSFAIVTSKIEGRQNWGAKKKSSVPLKTLENSNSHQMKELGKDNLYFA